MAETADVTIPVLIAVSALSGAVFWRQNTGVFLTLDGKRHVKVSAYGVADILGGYRSRGVAIETKTRTGKLRTTQIRFRDAWTKTGNVYIIARSPEEALEQLAFL